MAFEKGPGEDVRRQGWEVVGLGLNVVVAAFLFGFLGHWLGTKIGAEEILALVGGFIGAAAGFYSLYLHLSARPQQDRENRPR